MTKFSEVEFTERADEAAKAFVGRLEGQSFPIDARLKLVSSAFQELDPISFSFDDSGVRIMARIKEILTDLNYTNNEVEIFASTLLSLEDGFNDFFGSIVRNAAVPVRIPPTVIGQLPPNPPPEVDQYGDGLPLDLWILTDDFLGTDDAENEQIIEFRRQDPVVLTIATPLGVSIMVVPTYVAVLAMATVVFAVLGWDGRGNLLKDIERGFRKMRDEVKRFFRKIF